MRWRSLIVTLLYTAALVVMTATEVDLATKATFLLAWALLNFFWLAVLRRPSIAALLSLAMVVALILLSQFKHDKLMMTVNFVDLMIIDPRHVGLSLDDHAATCAGRSPRRRARCDSAAGACFGGSIPSACACARARSAALCCMGALVALSLAFPTDLYGEFFNRELRVEIRALRRGRDATSSSTHGLLESDARPSAEQLKAPPAAACSPARKLPHIILLHDESSFDITAAPGINVPPGYSAISVVRRQGAQARSSRAPAARAGSPNTTC